MSTSHYILMGNFSKTKTPVSGHALKLNSTPYISLLKNSVENFYDKVHSYFTVSGCRDLLLESTEGLTTEMCGYNNKIRIYCIGETYQNVVNSLGNKKTSKLSKFYSKLLGFDVRIRKSGQVSKKYYSYIYDVYFCEDVVGEIEKTLYIEFSLPKNKKDLYLLPTKISALQALLRETIITEKIISGEILNLDDVFKELLEISYLRHQQKDYSYRSTALANVHYGDLSSIEELTMDALDKPFNDDGSDFLSIMLLAIFLKFSLDSMFFQCMQLPQYPTTIGPVDTVTKAYYTESFTISTIIPEMARLLSMANKDVLDFYEYINHRVVEHFDIRKILKYVKEEINGKKS